MWHRFFRLFCSVFPPCAAFVDLPCLIAAWQGPSFCLIGYDPSRCLLWKWLNRDRNCSTYQLIWLGNCVSNYRKLYHNFLGCGMLLKHGFIIPKLQLGPVPPVAFHKTACVNLNCLSSHFLPSWIAPLPGWPPPREGASYLHHAQIINQGFLAFWNSKPGFVLSDFSSDLKLRKCIYNLLRNAEEIISSRSPAGAKMPCPRLNTWRGGWHA